MNRTIETSLEVQVLADVALPLIHDRNVPWDFMEPDLLRRMLLRGLAVDRPADAAALRPDLLNTVEQAKSALRRAGSKAQVPYEIYKGVMVLSPFHRTFRRLQFERG